MLPAVPNDLRMDFEFVEQPSLTYKINFDKLNMFGYIDEREAVMQAIYLILNTERYQYMIYSWNYGIELNDLYGQPIHFVLSELKRKITEALLYDSRITNVNDFLFEVNRNQVRVMFKVDTIFGDIEVEKVVII